MKCEYKHLHAHACKKSSCFAEHIGIPPIGKAAGNAILHTSVPLICLIKSQHLHSKMGYQQSYLEPSIFRLASSAHFWV